MLTILQGDCIDKLRELPPESVHCCVTSPPYWGLRDYGVSGQIGMEATYPEYVSKMVEVFSEVRRVLRADGTLWLNLGDCYATGAGKVGASPDGGEQGERWKGYRGTRSGSPKHTENAMGPMTQANRMPQVGLKPKDLVGIPWRVAFALQAAGWWLRSEIIWNKPNPMPESVTDRPTKCHEHIFLLTKGERYYYDQESILEPVSQGTHARLSQNVQAQVGSERANGGAKTNGNMKAVGRKSWKGSSFHTGKTAEHQLGRSQEDRKFDPGHGNKNNQSFDEAMAIMPEKRNKRTVWTVPTFSFSEAHFATFPPDLIRPCILAGCPVGGTVLDPFGGSGTTGQVAIEEGRAAILIELNPAYIPLIERRTTVTKGLGI